MSVLMPSSMRRCVRTHLAILATLAGLALTQSPAQAATWGHLRGPFSVESQWRERADYAAEEREELRRGYGCPMQTSFLRADRWDRRAHSR